MEPLFPEIEPYESGMLEVGHGQFVYWESCGNPRGKPAVVLHGGPGSGCTPWHRRLFHPEKYRVVLFDQRNCGRSRPHASDPSTELSSNTTDNLLADIEALRAHLGVSRWLVLGGSWGSALALAYAEALPSFVSELVLFGITTGRRDEFDWLFRDGLRRFFPEQWDRRLNAVPPSHSGGDIVEAYHRLLHDRDPEVRAEAALNWCLWESATAEWPPTTELASRFRDPSFRLAFARIVTHYVRNDGWLGNGKIFDQLDDILGIPAVLINGRYDFQAPLATAWELHQRLPRSELVVVDNAGHAANNVGITEELVRATERFAEV